jgi:hypothetical protein
MRYYFARFGETRRATQAMAASISKSEWTHQKIAGFCGMMESNRNEEYQRLERRLNELLKLRRIFSKAGRGRMDMNSGLANEVMDIERRLSELDDLYADQDQTSRTDQ